MKPSTVDKLLDGTISFLIYLVSGIFLALFVLCVVGLIGAIR